MKKVIFVICMAAFAAACGGAANQAVNSGTNKPANNTTAANTAPAAAPGNKMYVQWMEAENKSRSKDITIKQGIVRMSTDAPPTAKKNKLVVYDLILANYTFDAANLPGAMPKQYGDTLLVVQIIGDKEASQDGPPKAMSYAAGSSADGDNLAGKVWNVMVKYSDDGVKDGKMLADSPNGTRKGQLTITSVADGKMTGEIDISDDKSKVKGSFVVDMPKK